jgi:hypothetical protein
MSLTLRGDLNPPAGRLELVLYPERSAHHLDAGLGLGPELQDEPSEPVLVGRNQTLLSIAPAPPIAHQAARP